MAMKKKKKTDAENHIGRNKQARRLYEFIDTFEAGLSLKGTEVKSLRAGKISFKDGYVRFSTAGEAFLVGVHIAPYDKTGPYDQHDPERPRKLLLHKREIEKLKAASEQKGYSVIPFVMYFKRGKAKVQIALGKGKNVHSRKEDLKARDIARDTARQLSAYK
ncbi:MAG: SsrA-binding protein SmpB [Desulfovibrio sp.]